MPRTPSTPIRDGNQQTDWKRLDVVPRLTPICKKIVRILRRQSPPRAFRRQLTPIVSLPSDKTLPALQPAGRAVLKHALHSSSGCRSRRGLSDWSLCQCCVCQFTRTRPQGERPCKAALEERKESHGHFFVSANSHRLGSHAQAETRSQGRREKFSRMRMICSISTPGGCFSMIQSKSARAAACRPDSARRTARMPR